MGHFAIPEGRNGIWVEIMDIGIPGKRKRGRPTRRWMDNIRKGMRDMALEEENSGDRGKWRQAI